MVVLSESFREHPLWLDDLPPWAGAAQVLPARLDVLVIGSGYTGLNAALETARGGRSTLVIDAAEAGAGCRIAADGPLVSHA